MVPDVIWVGIDVGRYFHAICGIDSSGHVVWERRRVINSNWAISRALERLRHFAQDRSLRFGTEETTGNAAALVRLLAGANEIVYLAQPLRVHRFHLALGQPHKSDPYDAQVIAQFVRQNVARLPRVRFGTPDVQALRVLSRQLESVSKDLRRCLSRLRHTLAEYAPEWLICSPFRSWSSQAALGILERYGRISKLRRTPVRRLAEALSRWSRGRRGEVDARALRDAFSEVSLPPVLEEAYGRVVVSLVSQIRHLLAEKQHLLQLIAAQADLASAFSRLQAESGYGLETAATIISEVGDIRDFPLEPGFATYCGVTPIKRSSGISQGSLRLSRFTNKRLLRAIFQATVAAAHSDPRSIAYYQMKLAGRSDPRSKVTALLALARHRTRRPHKLLRQCSTQQPTTSAA